jgi:hypothetical protein
MRLMLLMLSDLLSLAYPALSVAAVSSRYISSLKRLASHGKTSMSPSKVNHHHHNWMWISKQCFVHFYILGLIAMATVSMVHADSTITLGHGGSQSTSTHAATMARLLLALHLCRRAYECLFVQQYDKQSSKMHIAGYALGMGHYLVLPLVFWDVVGTNGAEDHVVEGMAFKRFMWLVVLAMFNLYFQYEQHQHHLILASLRSYKKQDDDNSQFGSSHEASSPPRHVVHSLPPPRRWFRWILCPHYLAEILLYLSFALILETTKKENLQALALSSSNSNYCVILPVPTSTCQDIAALLRPLQRYRHWMLVMWVTANLTVSALNNYDWYQEKYYIGATDVRKDGRTDWNAGSRLDRKAVVPFLL